MKQKTKRNWSEYNQKIVRQASITLYLSEEIMQDGGKYTGKRLSGGVKEYSDALIEACLLIKIYMKLGYRQTQGFISSIFRLKNMTHKIPDYTTLCRRAQSLEVDLNVNIERLKNKPLVIAVDSSGLSLRTGDKWNRYKHSPNKLPVERWHKLHIAIDTQTGTILSSQDTVPNINDCEVFGCLMDKLSVTNIGSVCGDMAYDTFDCRKRMLEMKVNQLIPPRKTAIHTSQLKATKISADKKEERRKIFAQRDEALSYFEANKINGSTQMARKNWKKLVGYHQRSLVETAMFRIKAHTGSWLKSKNPKNMTLETKIKCKLLNILNVA
jgi:hypothetical protein